MRSLAVLLSCFVLFVHMSIAVYADDISGKNPSVSIWDSYYISPSNPTDGQDITINFNRSGDVNYVNLVIDGVEYGENQKGFSLTGGASTITFPANHPKHTSGSHTIGVKGYYCNPQNANECKGGGTSTKTITIANSPTATPVPTATRVPTPTPTRIPTATPTPIRQNGSEYLTTNLNLKKTVTLLTSTPYPTPTRVPATSTPFPTTSRETFRANVVPTNTPIPTPTQTPTRTPDSLTGSVINSLEKKIIDTIGDRLDNGSAPSVNQSAAPDPTSTPAVDRDRERRIQELREQQERIEYQKRLEATKEGILRVREIIEERVQAPPPPIAVVVVQKQEEVRQSVSPMREEFVKNVTKISDVKKRETIVKIDTLMSTINQNQITDMASGVDKLDAILKSFIEQASTYRNRDINTVALDYSIKYAQDKIITAREELAKQAARDYTVSSLDEQNLKQQMKDQKVRLQRDMGDSIISVGLVQNAVFSVATELSKVKNSVKNK